MAQTRTTNHPPPQQRSMADAIARAKAAAARQDRARAAGVEYTPRMQRLLFDQAKIPNHPHAKLVRRVTLYMLIAGALMIILLPAVFIVHLFAFALMYGCLILCMPNLVLQPGGAISPGKIAGWTAVLLLFGAMTATAMGDTGNLWDWAPWLSQFAAGSHAPHHVVAPKP